MRSTTHQYCRGVAWTRSVHGPRQWSCILTKPQTQPYTNTVHAAVRSGVAEQATAAAVATDTRPQDNRGFTDTNTAQKLTEEDILKMKNDGKGGQAIIQVRGRLPHSIPIETSLLFSGLQVLTWFVPSVVVVPFVFPSDLPAVALPLFVLLLVPSE